MSNIGILLRSSKANPVSVQVDVEDEQLVLVQGGNREEIALSRLYRVSDDPLRLRLGRRGARGWELWLSGEAANRLRRVISGRVRRFRWGAARAWHIGLFIGTVLLIELVKIPAEWLAPILPAAVEARLVPADLRSQYGRYCSSADGERAIRRLISRFDPQVARDVKIEVIQDPQFIISALPADRLVLYQPFLAALEADELAAFIAHEVAHLGADDAKRAALRAQGTFGALLGTVAGSRQPDRLLEFSPEEESRADLRALGMLLTARISPEPATAVFDRIEKDQATNGGFGREQSYLHYGVYPNRGEKWRRAPFRGSLARTGPAMTRGEADAVFNYCWRKTGEPRNPLPRELREPVAGQLQRQERRQ